MPGTDEINVTEQIMDLVKITSQLSTKVDNLDSKVDSMNIQLGNMSALVKNDAKQDSKIQQLETDCSKAHEKIRAIEGRIMKLEQSGAQRAKDILVSVGKYVGVAIIGAVLANIKDILKLIFK